MIQKKFWLLLIVLIVSSAVLTAVMIVPKQTHNDILVYIVDPASQDVKLYWQDASGNAFKSIQNLKNFIESRNSRLLFAMNGGMYKKNNSPQGLFIQEQRTISLLDSSIGSGNFYLKPNGVFYITTGNKPIICRTEDFSDNGQVKYATQSGPMLVIDGKIHPAFKQGSTNLNIRNGVGILPDRKIVFAMAKKEINFYEFASFFKDLGCKNALYLDGFVSRTYLPEQNWIQLDGDFGVIIGITEPKK